MARPRRSILRLLGAGVAGLAGCTDGPASTPPTDSSPTSTDVATPTETPTETAKPTEEETPTEPPPAKQPDWTFDTRGDIQYPPTEADGVLYVPSGSRADALFALDGDDGTERWRHRPDVPPASKPLVRDAVYFVTWSSRGTAAVALETDGNRRWRYVPEDVENVTRLELLALGPETVLLGGSGHHGYRYDPPVFAVDRETGVERWRRMVGGPGVHRVGQTVYVDGNDTVVAVDLTDGTTLWQRRLEAGVVGTSGDVLLAANATTRTVSALWLADGSERWCVTTDFPWRATLDSRNGRVYLAGEDELAALSVADGDELWRTSGYGLMVQVRHVGEKAFYLASEVDHPDYVEPLVAVDGKTGAELWRHRPGYNVFRTASLDGNLYVLQARFLDAYNPAGDILWRFESREDLSGLEAGATGVFVGGDGGNIKSFKY